MIRTMLLGAAVLGVAALPPHYARAQDEADPPAVAAPPRRPAPAPPQTFASPEAGFAAVADAARAGDDRALIRILGEAARPLIRSGDPAQDKAALERFSNAYAQKAEILHPSEDSATLQVGNDAWPLPIPMVRSGGKWRFDPGKGVQELVTRRIGQNELDTIQVLEAIVDAQDEYARTEGRKGAFQAYARRLFSTPGKHDGLYWASAEGEPESPLGPLAAAAAATGVVRSAGDKPTPYHGYVLRLLERQGPNAPGGALDYVVNGLMIGGFGVIAMPAQWGVTGIQTFMVSHSGVVYQRNLGPETARIAPGITAFDPGPEWQRVEAPKPGAKPGGAKPAGG